MRNSVYLFPSRYNSVKPSGSNKFISAFDKRLPGKGVVVKKSESNWNSYKLALKFSVVIGLMTYLLVHYLLF